MVTSVHADPYTQEASWVTSVHADPYAQEALW